PGGAATLRARSRGVRAGLAVAVLGVLLSGCAASPARTLSPPGQIPAGETLTRSELFFGRSRPDGRTVTDAEWAAFVDEEVTPRFPDGLTILDAIGQYRDRSGRILREATKVLLIVHPTDERSRAALEEMRALPEALRAGVG